ncbi:MAG: stalk domain-containing protein, partial [Bacillota bacterium]
MRKLKCLSLPALYFILAGLLLAGTVFVFTRPAAATGAAYPAPLVPVEKPVIVNGQELKLKQLRQHGITLVPVRALAEALQARVEWDPVNRTVTVDKPNGNKTIRMASGSNQALKNGQSVNLGCPAIMFENRIIAPLRFVAEALGAAVKWDEKKDLIQISLPEEPGHGSPPENTPPPDTAAEKVYSTSSPSRVAFTRDGCLWLADGQGNNSPVNAVPVPNTCAAAVKILGWSPDGQWLAYLLGPAKDNYGAKDCLWVVRADGTGTRQVEQKPVAGIPAWSPAGSVIAYSTYDRTGGTPEENLKLAEIAGGGQVKVSSLLPEKSDVVDFAWAPDGQSLAVSFPRTEDNPLQIDRVTLKGERTNLLSLGKPLDEKAKNSIYTREARGLKWSPNGRYLAYHLQLNSASLSADGVAIQVLDLQKPGRPVDVGIGLSYARWLAWSPDGTQLACILGSGRV